MHKCINEIWWKFAAGQIYNTEYSTEIYDSDINYSQPLKTKDLILCCTPSLCHGRRKKEAKVLLVRCLGQVLIFAWQGQSNSSI